MFGPESQEGLGWGVRCLWMDVCARACVRARMPQGSWLRWCRRWVGCDSPSLPVLLLLSDRLWCEIWLVIDSGSCAVVCQQGPMCFVFFCFAFFFYPPPCCQLYLEVKKKFHDLYNHFLCVKEYLSDYYWQVIHIYSQLPMICSHTLQPREKWRRKKKKNRSGEKPLKRRDNELKSLCALVSCSKPSRGEAIANEGKDSSQSQRDVSCPASVEWQRAKWAWPLRRGNSITVCQSWGAARDRLLLHYKKKKEKS